MKLWKMLLLIFALGAVIIYFAVDFIHQRHISEQREFTGKGENWEVFSKLTSEGERKYHHHIEIKYLGSDNEINIREWKVQSNGIATGGGDFMLDHHRVIISDDKIGTSSIQFEEQQFFIKWNDDNSEGFILKIKEN